MRKTKVVILCGGFSDERQVSLNSGNAVFNNTDLAKYDPVLIDVLSIEKFKDIGSSKIYTFNELISKYQKAVFFPVLHGEYGEDGVLQYLLEKSKVKFTGSKFFAHSTAINKYTTKLIAKELNIKCANHKYFNAFENLQLKDFPNYTTYVIKPNSSGSSVGVSVIKTKTDAFKQAKLLLKSYDAVLIEEYLMGDEIDCAVIGNKVFPLALIRPSEGHLFFDYNAKYKMGECNEIIPAPINKRVEAKIKNNALRLHKRLGCKGITRSEFIIKNNEPYFLEINTTPGMTRTSLVPQQAKAEGISFKELIDMLIDEAI